MTPWTAIALALAKPGDDDLGSRLPTYLHPLAGRPLAWHTLAAVAAARPAPARTLLILDTETAAEPFRETAPDVEVARASTAGLSEVLPEILREGGLSDAPLLLVDAAAATLLRSDVERIVGEPPGCVLVGDDGSVALAWLMLEEARALLASGDLRTAAARELRSLDPVPDLFVVRDRAVLARAQARIRDRIVHGLMEGGATFLLPASVLVDVDVRIGRDTVIYPGTVLEGQTAIGDETVVGPGCRIVDSWVGSGVELKGWNYISHTEIRNRAILEPYVRRGYD